MGLPQVKPRHGRPLLFLFCLVSAGMLGGWLYVATSPAAAEARLTGVAARPGKGPVLAVYPDETALFLPTPRPSRATPVASPGPTSAATPATIRAKIEVVWPHEGAPVKEANLANITAYLISETGNDPPACLWEPTVRLWAALNAGSAQPVAVGEKRILSAGGRTFPVWDFNNIDVSPARDPANKISFFVTVDGVNTRHNVWVHAADARTILPQPDVPIGAIDRRPSAVDALIEIVWPHEGLPIEEAAEANITAYLLSAGTQRALSPKVRWSPTVRLHQSLNADTEEVAAAGSGESSEPIIGTRRTITTENGVAFLAWDFNDIDVSAAQDPLNKIYFWLSVDDELTFPNVWAHGANPPTLFPQPDVLNSCR